MKHITGLAHIALFTKDLEASVKFYECLGGKVTGQADVAEATRNKPHQDRQHAGL